MEKLGREVLGILALAFLAESMTEYFLSEWLKENRLKYAAAVVGVLLALNFRVDIFLMFFEMESWLLSPYSGWVLTGLFLGRGSNYCHDFFQAFLTWLFPPGR